MSYTLLKTDKFNEQLNRSINYVADIFGKKVAIEVLNELENKISLLKDFPYKGIIPYSISLKRRNYRALIVNKHLVIYEVLEKEKQVILYGLFSSKQEYLNLI